MKPKPKVIIGKRVNKAPRLLDLRRYLPTIIDPSEFGHLKAVLLTGIPIPISENEQYQMDKRLSRQANWFINQMRLWGLKNLNQLTRVHGWIQSRPESIFQMEITLHFERSRIWTKDGRPKRLDGHNYKKLLIDCIAELLGVDDSVFFKTSIEKRANTPEMVTILISEYFVLDNN